MRSRFLRHIWGPLFFLLIWGVILGTPRLRHLALYQATSDETLARWAPYALPLAKIFVREASPDAVAARYPDDARVQMWAMAEKAASSSAALAGPPDELLRRFPNEAWLHASWLRSELGNFRSGRVAGTLDGLPGAQEKPPSLSRERMERALEIARRGAELERRDGAAKWFL
jgi:hypothetical protein